MMQISHAATAAAFGTQIDNIYLAFIGGVVIHFLIDKIPHYWPASKKLQGYILPIDYLITLTFIYILNNKGLGTPAIYYAIVGSLIVDIFLVGFRYFRNTSVGVWHGKRQLHKENLVWAIPEVAIILISIAVIYYGFGR